MNYPIERFTMSLSTTYGKQRSEEILKLLLIKASIPYKTTFSQAEAMKICETMILDEDKFLKIMGNSLKLRIMLGK